MDSERDRSEKKDSEKKWVWGDELEAAENLEKDSGEEERSFTSVSELLEAEDVAEIKRLEEFFRKKSNTDPK
jgi:hypothetical protein